MIEAVKIENMSDVWSGKEHGVGEREGGGGTPEDEQGGEEWKEEFTLKLLGKSVCMW